MPIGEDCPCRNQTLYIILNHDYCRIIIEKPFHHLKMRILTLSGNTVVGSSSKIQRLSVCQCYPEYRWIHPKLRKKIIYTIIVLSAET